MYLVFYKAVSILKLLMSEAHYAKYPFPTLAKLYPTRS